MLLFLLVIFILLPILEIITFIQVDALIGLFPTIIGILATAFVGIILVRQQGFAVMQEARAAHQRNEVPVEPALHGFMILVAGSMLITPGFITDTIGFLLLVPAVRRLIARHAWSHMALQMRFYSNAANAPDGQGPARPGGQENTSGPVIDGEAVDLTSNDNKPNASSPWLDKPRD